MALLLLISVANDIYVEPIYSERQLIGFCLQVTFSIPKFGG